MIGDKFYVIEFDEIMLLDILRQLLSEKTTKSIKVPFHKDMVEEYIEK